MKKMTTGIIVRHQPGEKMAENLRNAAEMGFTTCQLASSFKGDHSPEEASRVLSLCEEYHVTVTAIIAGWSGPAVWDFLEGPLTLGLIPTAYRGQRFEELKNSIDFAALLKAPCVNTHIGFIPEDPNNTVYREIVSILRQLCNYAKPKGVAFMMETGQETPITLLRTILDTGCDNLGINLDPANLLMYGKANPIDALDIIGKYVHGVHGKDGDYPTNPYHLGEEKALGKGRVDFPRFIEKLWAVGYRGSITIEREIPEGDERNTDIANGKALLDSLIEKVANA